MLARIITLAFGLSLVIAGPLAAQRTANATASITIPEVLYIDLDPAIIDFGTISENDLDAGEVVASTTSSLTHRGNVAHKVEVEALAADMTPDDSGNTYQKSAGDLQLSVNGGTDWVAVGGPSAPNDLVSSAARGQHNKTVGYRMLVSDNDAPDTYTLDFKVTVIAN